MNASFMGNPMPEVSAKVDHVRSVVASGANAVWLGGTVQGAQETIAALDRAQNKVLTEVVEPAIQEGAKILVRVMSGLVPVRSGTLKAAVGERTKAYKSTSMVWAGAGVLRGKGRMVNTKTRIMKKGIRKRITKGSMKRTQNTATSHWEDPDKIAHLADTGRKAVAATKKKTLFDSFGGTFMGKSVAAASGSHFIAKAEQSGLALAGSVVRIEIDKRLPAVTQ